MVLEPFLVMSMWENEWVLYFEYGSNTFVLASASIFIRKNYQLWNVKIQTYLQSFSLWDVVKNDDEVLALSLYPISAQLMSHNFQLHPIILNLKH